MKNQRWMITANDTIRVTYTPFLGDREQVERECARMAKDVTLGVCFQTLDDWFLEHQTKPQPNDELHGIAQDIREQARELRGLLALEDYSRMFDCARRLDTLASQMR